MGVRMTWITPDVVRAAEPFIAGERTMLAGWPDFYRTTLLMKCAGLTGERSWFRRHMNGEDVEYLYWRHDAPEAAFEEAGPSTAADDYASLMMEWELSRLAIAGYSLDGTLSPNAAARYPCAGSRPYDRGIRPP